MKRERANRPPTCRLRTLLVALAPGLLSGCPDAQSAADDGGTTGGTGIVTLTNTITDSADSSTGGSVDDSGSSSSSDTTGTLGLNCSYIDFVFVVDNSSSMADEQQNLVDAVPGFVEAMETALPSVMDFRVGIIDTDTYPALGTTEPLDGCPPEEDCASCDYQLGAFLSKPQSAKDPMMSCDFASGTNWIEWDSQSENASFESEFECAAIVGTEGNPVEQQVGALVSAVSPEQTGPGGCNEGFVRENALLVFLMITDEEDDHTDPPDPQGGSLGEPAEWYDVIVEVKGGKSQNVVALGLIGGSPRYPDCPQLNAEGHGAEQTTRLEQFVESFDTHFLGSVCAEGYDAFFNEALEAVSQGCMNYIP